MLATFDLPVILLPGSSFTSACFGRFAFASPQGGEQ